MPVATSIPAPATAPASALDPVEAVARVAKASGIILDEIRKVVVGHSVATEQLLIALLAGGHCLLRGGVGTAKSLTTSTLARVLHLKFNRVGCTPELTPEDVVGRYSPWSTGGDGSDAPREAARFDRGPVFANVVLADEINRTPYRTQSALLQPMQELRVVAGGQVYELDLPFFLVAALHTDERQPVFPLSHALTDRFLFCIDFSRPTRDEELRIALGPAAQQAKVRPVLRPRDVLWIQQLVPQIPATEHVIAYAVDLIRATRPDEPDCPDMLRDAIARGAGPRAVSCLLMAAKARAVIKSRCAVHAADIRAVLAPILRHRVRIRPEAVRDGLHMPQLVARLIECVPERRYGESDYVPPELTVLDRGENLPPAANETGPDQPRSVAAPVVARLPVTATAGGPAGITSPLPGTADQTARSATPTDSTLPQPVLPQPVLPQPVLPQPASAAPGWPAGSAQPQTTMNMPRAPQMIMPYAAAGPYYGPGQLTMPYVMPVPAPYGGPPHPGSGAPYPTWNAGAAQPASYGYPPSANAPNTAPPGWQQGPPGYQSPAAAPVPPVSPSAWPPLSPGTPESDPEDFPDD